MLLGLFQHRASASVASFSVSLSLHNVEVLAQAVELYRDRGSEHKTIAFKHKWMYCFQCVGHAVA
jgi:hypothetical protein